MSAKLIPLHTQKIVFTKEDFFATYGEDTTSTFISFLDGLYLEYRKTEQFQTLTFKGKVDTNFKYKCLREFLRHLKG